MFYLGGGGGVEEECCYQVIGINWLCFWSHIVPFYRVKMARGECVRSRKSQTFIKFVAD